MAVLPDAGRARGNGGDLTDDEITCERSSRETAREHVNAMADLDARCCR